MRNHDNVEVGDETAQFTQCKLTRLHQTCPTCITTRLLQSCTVDLTLPVTEACTLPDIPQRSSTNWGFLDHCCFCGQLQSTFKSGSWLGSVHLTISQMFEMLLWWCSLCFIWSNCYSFFLAAIKMTADSSREETIIVRESRFYYSCHDFIVQSIVAICSI